MLLILLIVGLAALFSVVWLMVFILERLKKDYLTSSMCICPLFHSILSIQILDSSFFTYYSCYLYL